MSEKHAIHAAGAGNASPPRGHRAARATRGALSKPVDTPALLAVLDMLANATYGVSYSDAAVQQQARGARDDVAKLIEERDALVSTHAVRAGLPDGVQVPEALAELSEQASLDWNVDGREMGAGVVLGGPAFDYVNGSGQTQLASFGCPRLADDDPRDTTDVQSANARFAVGCVTFVRQLLATEAMQEGDNSASVAAIQFALTAEQGMDWLRLWNEGDFDACRKEWPEAPVECYDGADPLAAESTPGATDDEIASWAERHNLNFGGSATDARCAFEDAESHHLTRATEAAAVRGVVTEVLAELRRATLKFPMWPNDPLHALAVVNEEVGELAKATLQQVYEPHKNEPGAVRSEAVQAAAMLLRFLVGMDGYAWLGSEQRALPFLAGRPTVNKDRQ